MTIMEKLPTMWNQATSRLLTEAQPLLTALRSWEQEMTLLTSTMNAFLLIGVIALVVLRLTDGTPKRLQERAFLACISMGAFMQIFPFPSPEGIDWDTLLFRMGLFGWGVNAFFMAVRARITNWKR